MDLHNQGILKKYGIELIGAQVDAINKAEDREKFIEKIINKENLSFDESKTAFELLMEGKAEDQEG